MLAMAKSFSKSVWISSCGGLDFHHFGQQFLKSDGDKIYRSIPVAVSHYSFFHSPSSFLLKNLKGILLKKPWLHKQEETAM